MQDRTSANSMKVLLQRTAGPYMWVNSGLMQCGKKVRSLDHLVGEREELSGIVE